MPKFHRRAEARPDEILDAALRAFVESGFAATRIDEIAAAAGVTVGTVYRYFPSKEALVAALVARPGRAEWHRGREVSEAYGSRTARQIIGLLTRRWMAELSSGTERGLLLLAVREAARFPAEAASCIDRHMSQGRIGFGRALRHGMDRGEFPLLDIDATADAISAALMSGVAWQASFDSGSVTLLIDGMVRGLPRTPEGSMWTGKSSPEVPTPHPRHEQLPTLPEGQIRVVTLTPPATGT